MERVSKLLVEKVTDVEGVEELKRNVIEFLKQKVVKQFHLVDDFGRFFTEKLDQLLPPATRAKTLQRWAHVGLPVALGVLFLFFCRRCCGGGSGGGRATGKMMKAPGRGGRPMPRAPFESNPRAYFRDLHAGKDLVN